MEIELRDKDDNPVATIDLPNFKEIPRIIKYQKNYYVTDEVIDPSLQRQQALKKHLQETGQQSYLPIYKEQSLYVIVENASMIEAQAAAASMLRQTAGKETNLHVHNLPEVIEGSAPVVKVNLHK